MFCYLVCLRIELCVMFDLVFLLAWLPHFANMTFSTAAGFMAVMGVLYYGFLRREEAWRPWNILTFAFIMICAYSYREPCFLMALPIIGMETVIKFGVNFFKDWRPWVCVVLSFALIFGAMKYDDHMYGSDDWQQYREYNKMRAHLTDYVDYPDYDENQEFYESIDMNPNKFYAMTRYTYCMVEDYGQDDLRAVYEYEVKGEKQQPLKEKLLGAKGAALANFIDTDDSNPWLVKGALWFWLAAFLLLQVSIIWHYKSFRRRVWGHVANLIALVGSAGIVAAEWLYLAADGRFPDRVEEVIRLLTLCAGMYVMVRILGLWKPGIYRDEDVNEYDGEAGRYDVPLYKKLFGSKAGAIAAGMLTAAEIVLLVLVINAGTFANQIDAVAAAQDTSGQVMTNKNAVIQYCGEHPDNLYVLDTLSVTDGTGPYDDTKQGNWFMSGSWMNLSPVYDEKLTAVETANLGQSFLARDNVYFIAQGKKKVYRRMGIADEDKNTVSQEVVDTFVTPKGQEMMVYKVK
ncbi:MAG: hypothetical protein KBS66_05580 [Eubacterium sp.]|nr:hypothetical protein [Candidatus Colimonas fimequi]